MIFWSCCFLNQAKSNNLYSISRLINLSLAYHCNRFYNLIDSVKFNAQTLNCKLVAWPEASGVGLQLENSLYDFFRNNLCDVVKKCFIFKEY